MFTLNVDLFFSIPLPGFISSDRFAWNSPVRLPLISSVLLLPGKTKDFVFPGKRRTHWPAEFLTSQKNFTLRFRQTPSVVRKTEPDTRSRSNGLPAFYKLQFILPSRTQAYKRSYRPGNSRYSIPEGVPPGHIQIVFG